MNDPALGIRWRSQEQALRDQYPALAGMELMIHRYDSLEGCTARMTLGYALELDYAYGELTAPPDVFVQRILVPMVEGLLDRLKENVVEK